MAATTSRVVEWKEHPVQINEIPIEGIRDGQPQNCEPSYALLYAGHGRTDVSGAWRVSLPAISCVRPGPDGNRRPSVVATPISDAIPDVVPTPYILVAQTSGSEITIWSFDARGERATNVEFSWHCVVEGTMVG